MNCLFCYYQLICSSLCIGSSLLLLLQALYQLYFDPDMEHKNVAQKWLTQAQGSAQAWQFCWALLDPDKVCCRAPVRASKCFVRCYRLLQLFLSVTAVVPKRFGS